MNKSAKFLIPAILGLFLTSCGGGGGEPAETSAPKEESSSQSIPAKAQYTITFKDEEDNLLESKKWDEGATPSYTYNKQDTAEWDYTVQGWASSLGGSVITLPAVSADTTYWAVVNKVKQRYTVTFESNGGSSVAAITQEYGTEVAKPADPKKDNHSFVSWSYDSAGTQVVSWPLTLTKTRSFTPTGTRPSTSSPISRPWSILLDKIHTVIFQPPCVQRIPLTT